MKENQQFTTFDSFSVLSLLGVVLLLVGSIVSNAVIDQKESHARRRADQLAVQLLVGGYDAIRNSLDERSPASASSSETRHEGRIGMDPWGSPYYFRIFSGEDGRVQSVLVYSSGPNSDCDTSEEILTKRLEDPKRPGRITLGGDDIGVIELKQQVASGTRTGPRDSSTH